MRHTGMYEPLPFFVAAEHENAGATPLGPLLHAVSSQSCAEQAAPDLVCGIA